MFALPSPVVPLERQRCFECRYDGVQSPRVVVTEKACSRCKLVKPASAFRAYPKAMTGLNSYCRDCDRECVRQRHHAKTYGLSVDQVAALLEAQGGACAICGVVAPMERKGGARHLTVDHCHTSGEVRGILCDACNRCIVAMDHEGAREWAAKALAYLKR